MFLSRGDRVIVRPSETAWHDAHRAPAAPARRAATRAAPVGVQRDKATPTPLPELDTFLAGLRGRRFFFAPVSGNNGDRLIEMGSRRLLADHGLTAVPHPRDADLIVINGGFAMSDLWPHGFDQCRRLSNRHPAVPLLVLPSSFWIDTTDFPALFARRTAPLHLYTREPRSAGMLRRMRFPCPTGIGLDHDTALALAGSPWLADLEQRPRGLGHVLIVPRFDAENATVAPTARPRRLPTWARDRLSFLAPLRDAAAAWVARLAPHAHRAPPIDPFALPFVSQAVAHLRSTDSIDDATPILIADVSDLRQASFAEFCNAIAGATAVYTERLHVGILAGLLGRPTHLRAGNTHKIRGIFDHSLRGLPSVHMMEPTTTAEGFRPGNPIVHDVAQVLSAAVPPVPVHRAAAA
jgi:exopolysaccharide biosynthesis predicted pyruvyltransferase EpsI